jgi:DNA-binding XRE family transcriptional regulator
LTKFKKAIKGYTAICDDWIGDMKKTNNLKTIRESKLMSKSELARKAGVSAVTIDRIERGELCRMETMRKIILALGFTLDEKDRVFHE